MSADSREIVPASTSGKHPEPISGSATLHEQLPLNLPQESIAWHFRYQQDGDQGAISVPQYLVSMQDRGCEDGVPYHCSICLLDLFSCGMGC